MRGVGIVGSSMLAMELWNVLEKEKYFLVDHPEKEETFAVISCDLAPSPSSERFLGHPTIFSIDRRYGSPQQGPEREPTRSSTQRKIRIDNAETLSIKRLLRGWPELERAHLTVILHTDGENKTGPIDSLIPVDLPWDHFIEEKNVDCSGHAVVAQHTRSTLIGCTLTLSKSFSYPEVLERWKASPRTLLMPPKLRFDSSSVLSEFFRDMGRSHGLFWETVIFPETLTLRGRSLTFWSACSELAVLPEICDTLHVLSGLTSSLREAERITDRDLNSIQEVSPSMEAA